MNPRTILPASAAGALLLAAALLLIPLGQASGQDPAIEAAGPKIEVVITQPSFLKPVFGAVDVVADVYTEETVTEVEFFVNGSSIGVDTEAPYAAHVDVGQANREHRFRVVVHTASGATGEGIVDTPRIQVDEAIDLGLQQLYVTATRDQERVLTLGREDFQVVDDGSRQKLVTFEGGDVPLTAILLMDVSESMQGSRLDAAVRGATAFIRDMRDLDEVMLLMFSDQLVRATDFSGDKEQLVGALQDVEAVGGTALNDHLYMAFNYLDSRQGRRVIVVLSDGIDLLSVLRMRDVLWRGRRSQALVYWIHLGGATAEAPQVATSWRNVNSNTREFEQLRSLVEESGGRVELLAGSDELEGAYRGILAELREQYVLGYYPSDRRDDGSWRPVRVRVSQSGIKVRAREGYID